MKYFFMYKKGWFWKKISVIGHRVDENQNKMVLFLENGGIREICEWNKCEIQLGTDWVLHQKKQMETASGLDVKLNVPLNN